MKKDKVYKYKLIQNGLIMAVVESSEKEYAIREIKHYAMMYGEDGPVKIIPPIEKAK